MYETTQNGNPREGHQRTVWFSFRPHRVLSGRTRSGPIRHGVERYAAQSTTYVVYLCVKFQLLGWRASLRLESNPREEADVKLRNFTNEMVYSCSEFWFHVASWLGCCCVRHSNGNNKHRVRKCDIRFDNDGPNWLLTVLHLLIGTLFEKWRLSKIFNHFGTELLEFAMIFSSFFLKVHTF